MADEGYGGEELQISLLPILLLVQISTCSAWFLEVAQRQLVLMSISVLFFIIPTLIGNS